MTDRNATSFDPGRRAVLAAMPALAVALPAAATGAAWMTDILDKSAVSLAAAIRHKDMSARDLMTVHLARVDALNPRIDAIVRGSTLRRRSAD